jgi:chorismate mutase/prephenate dehydratase
MNRAAPDPLQAIRSRIDHIDAEMHRLLIERSRVIGELIELKGLSKPGSALRPEREADMMRRLVLRHEGSLPLTTVEHIWREIITTFTAMQAPFGIAAGPAKDALAMRDLIRFYFGFSIPVKNCKDSRAAIRRVAASAQDIAVVAVDSDGRWWSDLDGDAAPKIFAKLPFVETASRPASLPAYVIGPPLNERPIVDIGVFAVSFAERLEPAVVSHGGRIIARIKNEVLIELPVAAMPADLESEIGKPLRYVRNLGGFYQPIRHVSDRIA